jgi:hypothetical protein
MQKLISCIWEWTLIAVWFVYKIIDFVANFIVFGGTPPTGEMAKSESEMEQIAKLLVQSVSTGEVSREREQKIVSDSCI